MADSPAIPVVDLSLGVLLIASFVSCGLYTLEIAQVGFYWRKYRDDRWQLKAAIWTVFLVDTVGTILVCICVYLYTISHWGHVPYLSKQNWPTPIIITTTQVVQSVVQAFLIYRYCTLSKRLYLSGFLCLGPIVTFAFAVFTSILMAVYPLYKERPRLRNSGLVWLLISAAVDIIVSGLLILELRRMPAPFSSTKSLINRLVVGAIQTGSVGSSISFVIVILYLLDNENNVSVGLIMILGRVYMLTMLRNLNVRVCLRSELQGGGSGFIGSSVRLFTTPHIQFEESIQVSRSAVIQMDPVSTVRREEQKSPVADDKTDDTTLQKDISRIA